MRKTVLIATLALGVVSALAATSAYAWDGSTEPGLVPWRGPSALGPWGIQPQPRHHRGGYRYGGAYYRGHEQEVDEYEIEMLAIRRTCLYRNEIHKRCVDGRCTFYTVRVPCGRE